MGPDQGACLVCGGPAAFLPGGAEGVGEGGGSLSHLLAGRKGSRECRAVHHKDCL